MVERKFNRDGKERDDGDEIGPKNNHNNWRKLLNRANIMHYVRRETET